MLVQNDADAVIDINGYFAPSTLPNDLSFYTLPPCRVRDTREGIGLFTGTLIVDTSASTCRVPADAQAVVLNATVVPAQAPFWYLTLWPRGQTQPLVSTLNASDGVITSNMAIVPTDSAVINAYGTNPTHLVLDTAGFFAAGISTYVLPSVLTVAKAGDGTGTVTSNDGKILCGGVCAGSYAGGTNVTLNATPASGNTFTGWSGGGCSGTGSCTVTVSGTVSVTARFNPPPTVTGNWGFTAWSSLYPVVSSGSGTLQQNGTSVTGQFTMSGSPCATYVTLNGTLTGTTFVFNVQEGSQSVTFVGTISMDLTFAQGTYYAPTGGCTAGDYGTWMAWKM